MKAYWRVWFNVKALLQKKLSDEIKARSQCFGTTLFLIQLDTNFRLQSRLFFSSNSRVQETFMFHFEHFEVKKKSNYC